MDFLYVSNFHCCESLNHVFSLFLAKAVKQALKITQENMNTLIALFIHLSFLGMAILSVVWDVMLMVNIYLLMDFISLKNA
jgi:hypothetical protein